MIDKRTIETREKILQAASQVTLTSGVGQLTLDAVASVANISKGGLLYHFRTKEALIEGMIDYYLSRFETRLEAKLKQYDDWLVAYIETSFESDAIEDQMSASLLAAVVLNPELLNPLRERYQQWQKKLDESSKGSIKPTAIRLILDGLWISNLLNLAPLSGQEIEKIRQYLLTLSGE